MNCCGIYPANTALNPLLVDIADSALLDPPINVLRLSLHLGGLAPRIANFTEWRTHLLDRLHHRAAVTADRALAELIREISAYPVSDEALTPEVGMHANLTGVSVPLKLVTRPSITGSTWPS